jgi:hypothetical protein
LHALVELLLESAPVSVRRQDDAPPGRAHLGDLQAQPVERFLRGFDLPSLQRKSSRERRR